MTNFEVPPIENILNELKEVIDPELGLNIVDLGLVYEIAVSNQESSIEIVMTLTTPGCPMAGILPEMVEDRVLRAYPDFKIQVKVVWNPAWSPELISENGRLFLGMK